jgi:hypothetical protein
MAGEIINRLNVGQVVNVKLTDSAVTNGQNLVEAYNYAKTLTPNGAALSATNRVSVIIQPGNYTLAAILTVDTQFVDLIGLGATKLSRGCVPAVIINRSSGSPLNVTANDVRVKGISVGSGTFNIGNNLPLQIFEDCLAGGSYSFGSTIVSGTFINCTGGQEAFAGVSFVPQTANGTFINCVGGNGSFAAVNSGSVASGLFVNCTTGSLAFGSSGFGANATASGTFIDCEGGFNAFGGSSFPAAVASGTFINCVGGVNAFGNGGSATATGKFYRCRLTSGTFRTVTGTGLMRNCIDGNNNTVNQ